MCKVSDKSEMVGEIIGWFDMEFFVIPKIFKNTNIFSGALSFSPLNCRRLNWDTVSQTINDLFEHLFRTQKSPKNLKPFTVKAWLAYILLKMKYDNL